MMRKPSAILLDIHKVAWAILEQPRLPSPELRDRLAFLRAELAEQCSRADRAQFLNGAPSMLVAACGHVIEHARERADMDAWRHAALCFVPMVQALTHRALDYERAEGMPEAVS